MLFRTVTLAFGTVAPEGSLIKPEILPRSDCANSIAEHTRPMKTTRTTLERKFFIVASSCRTGISLLPCPGGAPEASLPDARRITAMLCDSPSTRLIARQTHSRITSKPSKLRVDESSKLPATTGGLQDTESRRSRAKTGLSGGRIILSEPKCNRIVALIEEAARAPRPGNSILTLTLEIQALRIQYALRLLPRQVQFDREDSCIGLEIWVGRKDGPITSQSDRTNQDVGNGYRYSFGSTVVAGLCRRFIVRCSDRLVGESTQDTPKLFELPGRLDAR